MALDFQLDLILPADNHTIFSRGAIDMTISLIKPHNLDLAQKLSAVFDQQPLPTNYEETSNVHQQMFQIKLANETVTGICDTIFKILCDEQQNVQPGVLAVAKALFRDWTRLATKLHDENK